MYTYLTTKDKANKYEQEIFAYSYLERGCIDGYIVGLDHLLYSLKRVRMLAWLGTITSIIGSFLVALGYTNFGYIFFVTGSVAWLIVAVQRKDKALGVLNFAYFVANVIGILHHVLRIL